ncbi:MAG: hypothetical protein ISS52_07855, partial [Dehalococcoidia bacterium]|nr:hypothetical protein [Dehalococcoidia bacterium]
GSGETKTLNGQLEYRRRKFPWWVLLLIVGLVVVGFVAWLLLSGRSISCSCPGSGFSEPGVAPSAGEPSPGAAEPTITLTAPQEGATLVAGSTCEIRWEATGSGIDYVGLGFSTDEGATWETIAENQPTVGTYNWLVPTTLSGDCRVAAGVMNAADELLAAEGRPVVIQAEGKGTTGALPVIDSFTANPASITSGSPSTLRWNVSGATMVTIDHGIGNVGNTDTREVTPATTTTYTLTATNNAGSVTKKVQVATEAWIKGFTTAVTKELDYKEDESGSIWSTPAGLTMSNSVAAGDRENNTTGYGYASFDIFTLAGSDVTSAELIFTQSNLVGSPFVDLGALTFEQVSYGPRALQVTFNNLDTLNNLGTSKTGTGSIDVTPFVHGAVKAGAKRFQVRIWFSKKTDGDGQEDLIILHPVTLKMTYR